MRGILLAIFLLLSSHLAAQQIFIEDFSRIKCSRVHGKGKSARLDLHTSEKGFTFLCGKAPAEVAEQEGFISVIIPRGTKGLTVQHPSYGLLVWKLPGKGLKKKRHYKASLRTVSATKEFHTPKQWAVITTDPAHAIVYIDSTMTTTQHGQLSLYLPVGKHACRIVSPFYQELTDSIEIDEYQRFSRHYELQPFYSYLDIETPWPGCQIYLDNKLLGRWKHRTGRLAPGKYHLTITNNDLTYYDDYIHIANAETKVMHISQQYISPNADNTGHTPALRTDTCVTDTVATAIASSDTLSSVVRQVQRMPVSLKAFNGQTEIWLNRELVALGQWSGTLPAGFYAVSTVKEGIESRTSYFWVQPGKEVKLDLSAPLADYGMLNISCNEVGADVFFDDIWMGTTPCILQQLPTGRTYRVIVVKGKKKAKKKITLKGNDIVNVKIKLK